MAPIRYGRSVLSIELLEDRSLLSGASDPASLPSVTPGELARAIAAVTDSFPGAHVVETSRDVDEDAVYEIVAQHEGRTIEVSVAPDGIILETETAIDWSELPDEVAASLATRFPDAIIESVEAVTTEGRLVYEVELDAGDQNNIEVEVDTRGRIEIEESADDVADMGNRAEAVRRANAVDAVAASQASGTPIARPLDETRENTVGRARHATSSQSPKHATAIAPNSDTEQPAEATPRVSTDDEARPVPLRELLLDAAPRTGDLPSSQAIESAPVDALLGEEASSAFGVVPAALVPQIADLMSDVPRFDARSFERGMQAFLDQLAALAAQLSGPSARLEVNSRIIALAVVLTGLGLEVARRGARKRKTEAGSPLPTMDPMTSWAWGLPRFSPGAEKP